MNVEKLMAQDNLINSAQVIGNKYGNDFAFVVSSVTVDSEKGRVGIVVSGNGHAITEGITRAMQKDIDIAKMLLDAADEYRISISRDRSRKEHHVCGCPTCCAERDMKENGKCPDIKP